MTSWVVEDIRDLDSVTDLIHDRWFDLDSLTLDSSTSVLEIKFEKEHPEQKMTKRRFLIVKLASIPVTEALLRIHFVKSYHVTDDAKVGRYDFNRLSYRRELQELSVVTGIPLDLRIIVSQLRVEVIDTEKVMSFKSSMSLF